MRQVAGLIPTYSSDEFGICSALYELGGMVVMHDASGCNSTYTTHDEPRWYDMDSMIFISAISEMEAIMGDDEKFIGDLIETAGELHPKFIAIVGAPIPYMIGTDFRAIASIVEEETGIPCFGFEANGMHDYTRGVSWALQEVVERFCQTTNQVKKQEIGSEESISDPLKESISDPSKESTSDPMKESTSDPSRESTSDPLENALADGAVVSKGKRLVNILGATPLDFSLNGSIDSIKAWLESHDLTVNCCMAMGSSLEKIKGAGEADVNLVISSTGIEAAKELKNRFGQPYVVGVPVKAPVAPLGSGESGKFNKMTAVGSGEADEFSKMAPLDSGEAGKFSKMTAVGSGEFGEFSKMAPADSGEAGELTHVPDTWRIRKEDKVLMIGEAVYASSLAQTMDCEKVTVACPLEHHQGIDGVNILYTPEEDDLMKAIEDADLVIADPFYQVLVESVEAKLGGGQSAGAKASAEDGGGQSAGAKTRQKRFIGLPHEAFSGRIYDAVNPNLIGESAFSEELIRKLYR